MQVSNNPMCPSINQVTAGPQTTTAAPTTDDSASVAAPDLKDKDPVSVDAHGLKVL